MPAKITSIGIKGLDGYRVQAEVQLIDGFESIVVVGLPDKNRKRGYLPHYTNRLLISAIC
ncbi:hypothetical protein [Alkalihalobacillus deserti]|uniref:hypothetical protein n=1 Tax=Alkalihalobacillus deserti TaxID=2879466 RepID=UPI001D15C1B4|nr:hypothetical protein [Alkalihalobacillus deserti]